MKVTNDYLKQVINEEVEKMIQEGEIDEAFGGAYVKSMLGQAGRAAGGAISRGATALGNKISNVAGSTMAAGRAGLEKIRAASAEADKAQASADEKAAAEKAAKQRNDLLMQTAEKVRPFAFEITELSKKYPEDETLKKLRMNLNQAIVHVETLLKPAETQAAK